MDPVVRFDRSLLPSPQDIGKAYTYRPIDQQSRTFRLIRLLPTQQESCNDAIRIELVHVDLDSDVDYDALSYAWNLPEGVTEPDRLLIVETEASSRRLAIFRPLEEALRHLQPTQSRLLFADQICIDQNNTSEKNHQVGLMKDIYAQCHRGTVWLGPGTPASDTYFSYANDIMSEGTLGRIMGPNVGQFLDVFDAVMDPLCEVTASVGKDRDDVLNMLSRYGSQYPLHGLLDVLDRLWFNRLWIIQEACLSPELIFLCGNQSQCYDCFRGGVLFFNIYNNYWSRNLKDSITRSEMELRSRLLEITVALQRIIQERKLLHSARQPRSLYDIILKYNVNGDSLKIGATKARDRIFGLLGLAAADDQLRTRINVDYEDKIHQVYTDIASSLLEHNLDTLLFSQAPKIVKDLPSWVPDWTMNLKIPHGYIDLDTPAFSAGNLRDPVLSYNRTEGSIGIQGIFIDTISHVGNCTIRANSRRGVLANIEYESVSYFSEEVSDFIQKASSIRTQDCISFKKDTENMLLRLTDGGLTMMHVTARLGEEQGIAKLKSLHEFICQLGWSLIVSNNYSLTHHLRRNIRARGVPPSYWFPPSEWEALKICAKVPKEAVTDGIQAVAELLSDVTLAFVSCSRTFLVKWYLDTRRRFARIKLSLTKEELKQVAKGIGMSEDLVSDKHRSVFLGNLAKQVGRKVYRTQNGHVGIGPGCVKPGDAIVILFGSTVPHVLRKEVDETDVQKPWAYIGETYCDGIMNGEAIGQVSAEQDNFVLR
ncbi:hypothetical protein S40285_08985 [Stachybotrys chlorohalonatus IBT 40285]|uniref:Heterokaryon incompatibility domain-containing protein n=1 Tax=Stachybotrys chlorohalonatus (strain IBT 40285) TaxID=1283841 RepID=A0A084R0Y4_STAC4|nr:hypothetical protein S40285_08985 [Stachybotrys chlorohalonata IBT 40285]